MRLFQQKAVQVRDGERLPAVGEPCCPTFSLPTVLLSQAVACCASLSVHLLSILCRRGWVLPQGCGPLFWSHLSIWTLSCSCHVVACHFFSCLCVACFQHLPVQAQSHWLSPSPGSQPLSSLAPKLLLHLRLPFSFKSPAQHSSTRFLHYSQGREGKERGDVNPCRSFLGITALV